MGGNVDQRSVRRDRAIPSKILRIAYCVLAQLFELEVLAIEVERHCCCKVGAIQICIGAAASASLVPVTVTL